MISSYYSAVKGGGKVGHVGAVVNAFLFVA